MLQNSRFKLRGTFYGAAEILMQSKFNARRKVRRGRLAQLVRAPRLHRGGQRFESFIVHHEPFAPLRFMARHKRDMENRASVHALTPERSEWFRARVNHLSLRSRCCPLSQKCLRHFREPSMKSKPQKRVAQLRRFSRSEHAFLWKRSS